MYKTDKILIITLIKKFQCGFNYIRLAGINYSLEDSSIIIDKKKRELKQIQQTLLEVTTMKKVNEQPKPNALFFLVTLFKTDESVG